MRSREFLRLHYDNLLKTNCCCENSKKKMAEKKDKESEEKDESLWNWCSVL